MPAKLIVHNIPQHVTQEEFRSKFIENKGFLESKILLNQNNEIYGIVEFVNNESAEAARKRMTNFFFSNTNIPITMELHKSQDYDYYSNASQNMNVSHHHMGGNLNQKNISQGNMNFQNPNTNFHYQSQNQHQNPELEVQSNFISHHQQNQQFPIDNNSTHKFNPNPYNMQGQNQIQLNPMQMPIYQGPNQNMMQGNIQPNISMLNPNENSMHGNLINPNISNLSTQPSLHQGHNVQHSNMPISGPSQGSVHQTSLSSNLPPISDPHHRNINQGQFIQFNPQSSNPSGPFPNMMNPMPNHQMQMHHSFQPNPSGNLGGGNFSPKNLSPEDLILFKTNPNATSSIYVDGVPIDATEREVAHVFRPFPGFQEVRLIKKEAKSGRQFYFCFVDFETSYQSTIALNTLQGYRFDKSDSKGLKISYAFHAPDNMKKSNNNNQQQQPQKNKFRNNNKKK